MGGDWNLRLSYQTEILKSAPIWWDDEVRSGRCESLCLFHTTPWAERLQVLLGYEPKFLVVHDSAGPRAMAVAFVTFERRGVLFDVLATIGWPARKSLLWHGQPVIARNTPAEDESAIFSLIGRMLNELCHSEKAMISAGQWPIAHAAAIPSRWSRRLWGTYRIDLGLDPDALFRSFKQSARKAIRRAQRDGILVRQVETLVELRDYYAFAVECAKRYGKSLHGFEDFATMWTYLRKEDIFETFAAVHDGQIIAGLSVWGSNGELQEIGSFQSQSAYEQKMFGPDMLKWHIINWAHDLGYQSFDLAGVNPDTQDQKEINIRRFKEKWGGAYSEYFIVSSNQTA